jgi:hypothetical protein
MKAHTSDLPDPFLKTGATGFERRILEAGAHEDPSPEVSKEMALALGISAGVAAVAAGSKLAGAAAAKTVASTSSVVLWPWVSIGLLGLVVSGVLIGGRHWKGSTRELHPPSAPAQISKPEPPPTTAATPEAPSVKAMPPESVGPEPVRRARTPAMTDDLREQIGLIDAARKALNADNADRTLQIVRRYQDRFTAGAFRPEATALKIEALVALGRRSEARPLAETFVAEHRGSALADRVARIAEVARR